MINKLTDKSDKLGSGSSQFSSYQQLSKAKSLMQWFSNQPISRKQLMALIACELVSVLGLGIGATLIITKDLRTQLLEQAKSEVAVTDINYNIKVNQMGFGFRGQSDNSKIIQAAINHNNGQAVSGSLKAEVKKILENEIRARKIEYATLVGKNLKIIVNANTNRQGEVFNPDNLVSEVLANPKQIKATRIVRWQQLSKETPPLPDSFSNQDALIRYTVTPVRESSTQTVVGALISGDIVNGKDSIVKGTLQATGGGYSAVYLRKPTGEFVLATALHQGQDDNLEQAQLNVKLPIEGISLLKAAANSGEVAVAKRITIGSQTYTMAAKAIPDKIIAETSGDRIVFGEKPVGILVRGTPETALNNLLAQSWLEQALSVLIALLLTGIWAVILRRTIIRPIENLQQAAEKFAVGDRTARAPVFATDEIGKLTASFNSMADNITAQVRYQENEMKLAVKLNVITARIRESLNHDKILKALVSSTKEAIQADRVIFCRLDELQQGTVIAESVSDSFSAAIGAKLPQLYGLDEIGKVITVKNVYEVDLRQDYLKQLQKFAVKAYLLAPIFLNKNLYGALIAHQCSGVRNWQDIEVNLFNQVAIQVGYALEQAELIKQTEKGRQIAVTTSIEERQEKENLRLQILKLLEQVEDAARGNLTVRAEVTAGEIGTVADFFNSIVESLRDIVTKVKASAIQVNTAIGVNEEAIRKLVEEANNQAAEINHTLNAVDQMTHSTQVVAESANLAAKIALAAAQTTHQNTQTMNLAVHKILHLRETVNETARKVKHLGESTQQISQVVSFINQIALQTNLLAINAGLEAQNAGEEGKGFAIVAEEVSELAARCASATQDIQFIVDNIQRETSEVVTAMSVGTVQVTEGTQIVEDAKYSLGQILEVSQQIDSLVRSISTATASQVQTSQTVSTLMRKVATSSQRTSASSHQVSQSLQQTLEISQYLQETVGTFQVN